MKIELRAAARGCAGLGVAAVLLCSGCEDDPRDLDYLNDAGAPAADAGAARDATTDAASDGNTDAAPDPNADAGDDDGGTGDAG